MITPIPYICNSLVCTTHCLGGTWVPAIVARVGVVVGVSLIGRWKGFRVVDSSRQDRLLLRAREALEGTEAGQTSWSDVFLLATGQRLFGERAARRGRCVLAVPRHLMMV